MTTEIFLASGPFTPPAGVTQVDVLIVAGGGAGGKSSRGGGGGGGGGTRLDLAVPVVAGVPIAVVVGAGGAVPGVALTNGGNGGDSSFAAPGGTLTATGGGGGGGVSPATAPAGGSGGGGAGGTTGVTNAGGAGTQGSAGGNGRGNSAINGRSGGGGGGRDAVGGAGASGQAAGAGGAGHDYSAAVGVGVGVAGVFSGGGGGGRTDSSLGAEAVGGAGGGGSGGGNGANVPHPANGTAGTVNTGGGGGGSGTTGGGGAGTDGIPGAGGSGVVVVSYVSIPPPPAEAYRVHVEVGSHVYDVTAGDAPDYGVTLPLSWGWQIPESVDFFPTQANPTTGSFGLVVPTVAEVDDLAIGDAVAIEVYVPSDAATPWQATRGVVTQLEASVGDRNRVTVYFSDPTVALADKVVGLGAWPIEDVFTRLGRICTEAGVTFDYSANEASMGLLPARSAGATDALSAIRNALKDDADRNTSYAGTTIYGRTVYTYDPDVNTLYVVVSDRTVASWPALLDASGDLVPNPAAILGGGLDGCAVQTDGAWSRLPTDRYSYVILDGVAFAADGTVGGAVSGVPYVRNTGFVDGPGPSFPSATARVYLARSLLPIPDEGSPGWRTDTIRHLSYLDPDPVTSWLGAPSTDAPTDLMPWVGVHPVIVTPVDPTLTLDGRGWITGTLTGARLTIPPGGNFYVDVTLRPTLFPPDPIRTPTGALRWQDIGAAVAWADLDPLLTWRDLTVVAEP